MNNDIHWRLAAPRWYSRKGVDRVGMILLVGAIIALSGLVLLASGL